MKAISNAPASIALALEVIEYDFINALQHCKYCRYVLSCDLFGHLCPKIDNSKIVRSTAIIGLVGF
jgi:L-ribulose-5-phosphate 3-epimerase UlaE